MYKKDENGRRYFPGALYLEDLKIGEEYYQCTCGSPHLSKFKLLDIFKYNGRCKELKGLIQIKIKYINLDFEHNDFASDNSLVHKGYWNNMNFVLSSPDITNEQLKIMSEIAAEKKKRNQFYEDFDNDFYDFDDYYDD